MKKLFAMLAILLCFSSAGYSQCPAAGTRVTEDYTSAAGWTFIDVGTAAAQNTACYSANNGSLNISGSTFNFVTATCGVEMRGFRSFTGGVGWDFQADFRFDITAPSGSGLASNGPAAVLLGLTENTLGVWPANCPTGTGHAPCAGTCTYPVPNNDAIWVSLVRAGAPSNCTSNTTQTGWSFFGNCRDGAGATTTSAGIPLTGLNTYYIRLMRVDIYARIEVYSNPTFTTLIGAACFLCPYTITNLDVIEHGVAAQGWCTRILNGTIDNLRIDANAGCWISCVRMAGFTVIDKEHVIVDGSALVDPNFTGGDYNWTLYPCDNIGQPTGDAVTIPLSGTPGNFVFNTKEHNLRCGSYYTAILTTEPGTAREKGTPYIFYVPCEKTSNESAVAGVSLFPNPGNGKVTLRSADHAISGFRVMDQTGKVIIAESGLETYEAEIRLDNFANGIYMVEFTTAGNAIPEVIKYIKQ